VYGFGYECVTGHEAAATANTSHPAITQAAPMGGSHRLVCCSVGNHPPGQDEPACRVCYAEVNRRFGQATQLPRRAPNVVHAALQAGGGGGWRREWRLD